MKAIRCVGRTLAVFATFGAFGAVGDFSASADERRFFQPADVHRLKDVGDLAISPDGEWVAYTVRTTDTEEDQRKTDLFMVNWDGTTRVQLTHTEMGSETKPRFSPDGRYLAFITSRGGGEGKDKDPKHKDQIWMLDRAGGEAFRLTELQGGVSSFEWSPDGKRIVVVSKDPDPEEIENETATADSSNEPKSVENEKSKKPKPIVVDRYRFKKDREGYLVERYTRLHLFDLASKETVLLTPGSFDSSQPTWSPNGKSIAFSSKRPSESQPDPDRNQNSDLYLMAAEEGAEIRRLTDWTGSDTQPIFSPDGKKIAYVQGPSEKYDFYDPSQLAIIAIDTIDAIDGSRPLLVTESLDRAVLNVRWSLDGAGVSFTFDDDRERFLGAVPATGGKIERRSVGDSELGKGVIRSFEIGKKGVAVLATFPTRPTEIYRLDDGLPLSDHNRELRDEIEWANVRGVEAAGKDGVKVGAMLLEPPGYEAGKAYPTIAYIHGGPVSQDAFEFDWMAQAFAAKGYLVVEPNYRGSSGRGTDFSRAIYGKWGSLEIQDIHTVMDYLVDQGLADSERLGIGGWSYGGINTNYSIATDTRFAAAVSGSGIANLLTGYGTDQYIWQYEGEIGKPWEKESLERYLELSYPFLHADRIKTPTLFMCGEKDFNVPLINSEQMYQALRSLGVPTRLVVYPGQFHGLTVPSYIQDRVERMIAWYDKYLRSEED